MEGNYLDAKLRLTDIQLLIEFVANSYSPEDIFSLGRNIGISKNDYFGLGMNNTQLSEAFVTRVTQLSKEYELIDLIENHEYLKRDKFSLYRSSQSTGQGVSGKSILDTMYAIIIGVNDYSGVDAFDSLNFSSKDAADVKELVLNTWKVDKKNVYLLNDVSKTCYDPIKKVLHDVLPSLSEDDNLLFYFSGHGDEVNGKSYLILSDTEENPITHEYINAIVLDELNELFKQCKAKIKMRLFDACKCGQSFSKGKSKLMTPKFRCDMFGSGNGWITITSCNINEASYESTGMQNGIFTHFLIEGIKGNARRGNEKMQIEDVKIYISDNVPRKTNYKQNPQYQCEIEGNIFIE